MRARLQRNAFKESIMLGEIDVALLFQTDNDLIEMRSKFNQAFYDVFNEAFKCFIAGNWKMARKMFKQVESIKRMQDQPTRVLLDYMERTDFEPPEDWQGHRYQD